MTRIIYPQKAEPVFVDTSTPFIWSDEVPDNQPTLAARGIVTFLAAAVMAPLPIPTPAATPPVFTQLSEPVRTKTFHPVYQDFDIIPSVNAPETTVVSKWFSPLSEPVRYSMRLGVNAPWQDFDIIPPSTAPEQTLLSKWYGALSEPVRVKPGLGAVYQDFDIVPPNTAPEAVLEKWFEPLSTPVMTKAALLASSQQFIAYSPFFAPPEPTLSSKWFSALSEPVRTKTLPTALSPQPVQDPRSMTLPEQTLVSKWFAALSEPVRTLPRLLPALNKVDGYNVYFFPPEVITVDKYYIALSEPVRTKPGLNAALQKTDAISPTALLLKEDVKAPSWDVSLSEPVRLPPRLTTAAQSFFSFYPFPLPTPEVIQSSKWFQALSEPVRFRAFGVALQASWTGPATLVVGQDQETPWYAALSAPVMRRDLPVALQAQPAFVPVVVPPTPAPAVTGLTTAPVLPVWRRDAAPWLYPNFPAFVPVVTSKPIIISTGRYVLFDARSASVLFDPRPSAVQFDARSASVVFLPKENGENPVVQQYGEKTVYEDRCFTGDFTNLLAANETITSSPPTIILKVEAGPGDPNPAAMLDGAASVDSTGKIVSQWLTGGVSQNVYRCYFQISTNLRELVEGQVLLKVVNKLA